MYTTWLNQIQIFKTFKLNRISTEKQIVLAKTKTQTITFSIPHKKMSTNVLLTTIGTIAGLLPIIGFIITVVSWRKQSELNRENEIAKVRLKHRLELLRKTFECIIRTYTILEKNNGSPNPPTKAEQNYVKKSFDSISEGICLLGTKEEQQIWASITYDFNNNKNINLGNLAAFLRLTKNNYRRELGL